MKPTRVDVDHRDLRDRGVAGPLPSLFAAWFVLLAALIAPGCSDNGDDPMAPDANGACCFDDGSCQVQSSSDCSSDGGTYEGDDTSCNPNPCTQPAETGACCFADGSCQVQSASECSGGSGTYQGDDTSCDPNPCPQPSGTGACCVSDGSCQVLSPSDCSDTDGTYQGDDTSCDPNPCPQPGPLPVLEVLVPIRTVVGDSVRVVGTGFGDDPGSRTIVFAGASGDVTAEVLRWEDTEVTVQVPASALAGAIRVRDGDQVSKGLEFDVAPEVVSFNQDLVAGLFQPQGCAGCHSGPGGSSGLSVLSPGEIRTGGNNGPGAVPRRAAESLIVLKVTDPPFGSRMPRGGPPLSDEEVLLLSDWINQGMRDN